MALQTNDLAIYDTYADHWWDGSVRWLRTLHNLVPARLAYFERFVEDWSGKTVLDVGCGGGFMSEALAKRSAEVVGVDRSAGAVHAARVHAMTSGLLIDYRTGTAEDLAFDNESFDVVVCVDVLEHVEDVELAIQEMGRVLKPGGLFIFDTINRNWFAKFVVVTAAERMIRLLPRGAHDPDMFIRPQELHAMCKLADMSIIDLSGLGPTCIDRRLDIRFGKVPINWVQYMGVAMKADSIRTRANWK